MVYAPVLKELACRGCGKFRTSIRSTLVGNSEGSKRVSEAVNSDLKIHDETSTTQPSPTRNS